jgi:hypothetical protein
VWSGCAALLLLFASNSAVPGSAYGNDRNGAVWAAGNSVQTRTMPTRAGLCVEAVAVVALWAAGLLLAPATARAGQGIAPGQEGAVFIAIVVGPAMMLSLGLAARPYLARALGAGTGTIRPAVTAHPWAAASGAVWGFFLAIALLAALHVLLLHHYTVVLSPKRMLICVLVTAAALPALGAVALWVNRMAPGGAWTAAACYVLLGVVTAALSGLLFSRMSVAPGYLLAAVLVICAAHRLGTQRWDWASPVTLGAATIGSAAAVVCALY